MATTNELQQTLDNILNDKNTNLKPKNLKKGVTVLGVTGTYDIIDTEDATAESSDILEGKTAYVKEVKVTGTMRNNGTLTLIPSISNQILEEGYISGGILQAVTSEIDSNIQPENIRTGVTILGVNGNLEPDKPDQSKTADPTTSQQVIRPDEGYELASVTINPVTSSIDGNIVSNNIKRGVSILGINGSVIELNGETRTVNPLTISQTIIPNSGKNAITEITVNAVTSAIDSDIQPENIRKDISILGVVGTLEEGIDTSDATAVAGDIIEGQTAYARDEKITGTLPVNNMSVITHTPESVALDGSNLLADYQFSGKKVMRNGDIIREQVQYSKIRTAADITSDKIKRGESIFGVNGTVDELNGETTTVTPTTSQQTITPTAPKNGFTEVTVNAVTSAIDANIIAENIKEDVSILGVVGTFKGGEDLTAELTAQTQKLAELEAILENKTSGSAKPNIYVQLEEPTSKDGIWLQTDKEVDEIIADENVYAGEEWNSAKASQFNPLLTSVSSTSSTVLYNNFIYFFGIPVVSGQYSTTNKGVCKLNINTGEITSLNNIPANSFYNANALLVNDYIYLFGSYYGTTTSADQSMKYMLLRYNIADDSYTRLTDTPIGFWGADADVIGKYIYVFGGYDNYNSAYRYDTENDTWLKLTNLPYTGAGTSVACVNNNMYIFGSEYAKTTAVRYNVADNNYTNLTNIPYNFATGGVVAVDEYIYLIGGSGGSKTVYKYNTDTDSYIKLTDSPIALDSYASSSRRLVYVENNEGEIYLIQNNQLAILTLVPKDYPDKSVVISQGLLKYKTLLINTDVINGLKYDFNNVFYYTTENKFDTTIPTYYGDGTQWINFKNPPVEEVEE